MRRTRAELVALDARHALAAIAGLLPQITPAADEPGRPPLDLEDLLEPARALPHTTPGAPTMTTRAAALAALAWLRAMPESLQQVHRTHTAERHRLQAAEHWTQEHRATLIDKSRQTARDDVAQLVDVAASHHRTIVDYLNAADTRPATEQLLDEQRDTRAWARLRPLLDKGAVRDLVAEAEQAGDLPALRALRDELPAYLRRDGAGTILEQMRHDVSATMRTLTAAIARTAPADSDEATRAALQVRVGALTPLLGHETSTVQRQLDSGQYDALGYAVTRSYLTNDVEAAEAALTSNTAQEATT
jgi:hypothetical protein